MVNEKLIVLAMRYVPSDHPLHSSILSEVRRSAARPELGLSTLTEEDITALRIMLEELKYKGSLVLDDALLASILRFKKQTRIADFEQPLKAPEYAGKVINYFLLRNALGVLALAWQLQVHPKDLILDSPGIMRLHS